MTVLDSTGYSNDMLERKRCLHKASAPGGASSCCYSDGPLSTFALFCISKNPRWCKDYLSKQMPREAAKLRNSVVRIEYRPILWEALRTSFRSSRQLDLGVSEN